jgi:hypothetical protein
MLERDRLTDEPAHRPGTPQSRQLHGLLSGGLKALCEIFPGVDQDLADAGAAPLRVNADFYEELPGFDAFPRRDFGSMVYAASRPRLERAQLAEPQAAQDSADGRDSHTQLACDRRAAQALPPQELDLGHALGGHLMLTVLRCRAAVDQRRRPAGAVAREPAVRLPLRQSGRAGSHRHRPALFGHPLHQQASTLGRQTRILVHVHPGDLPLSAASVATASLIGPPRMNNLHSNHN